MKTLDKNKPFSEVLGMARVRYGQEGAYFDADGREVADEKSMAPETEPHDAPTREELEGMHWRKLKAMLNALDIEYTSREEAIKAILKHG